MSTRFAVGSTPSQLIFDSNKAERAFVNLGPSTVYVGDQSAVTAFVDMPVDVGGSFLVLPGQELWAVCASGQKSQLSAVSQFEQRFAYSQPVGKLIAGPAALPFTWTADATLASQFTSVLVYVGPNGSAYNQSPQPAINGTLEVYCTQGPDTALTNFTTPKYQIGGATSGACWPQDVYNAVTGIPKGGNYYQAVFPLTGSGSFTISAFSADGGTFTGLDVSVYGLRTAVPNTVIQSQSLTALAQTTGLQSYLGQVGNTYTVNVPTVNNSLTSQVVRLPAVPGPVRLAVQATQGGAGTFTVQPAQWLRMGTAIGLFGITYASPAWVPFDAALLSSTAAGSPFGAAQYGVWPTAPAGLLVTTGAAVNVTNLQVSLISGGL